MENLVQRYFRKIELAWVILLGRLFGISMVVRYLRNPNPEITTSLIRRFGGTVGDGTTFKRAVLLDNVFEDANSKGDFRHLVIGENVYIGDDVYFDLSNRIEIRNNVVVSGRCSLITHSDCNRSPNLAQKFPRKCEPIVIEHGAWLCFGVTVLAGVEIGAEAVAASGAVVHQSIAAESRVGGIPAKPL